MPGVCRDRLRYLRQDMLETIQLYITYCMHGSQDRLFHYDDSHFGSLEPRFYSLEDFRPEGVEGFLVRDNGYT
jgi:hypothetical protein